METKKKWKPDVLLVILIGVVILFSVMNPLFLSMTNFLTILRQIIITGVMACGLLFVIVGGNFDLSIGMLMTMSGIICIKFYDTHGIYTAVALAVIFGIFIGLINGFLVGYMKLNSMIVTLSMESFLTVMILRYSGGKITRVNSDSKALAFFDQGRFLGLPISIYVYLLIILFSFILLEKTVFGRQIKAVGGNALASRFSGINDRWTITKSYMMCGAMAGLGGVLYASRVLSVQVEAGSGYETTVLTIVILAGTKITGGEGKVGKTVLAATILGCLSNGFIMIGLPYYFQWIVQWVAIIAVVWMTANPIALIKKRREKSV